jgi:dolichyl-phosphate-mannose--protein O-mannosyl transferase
MDFAHTNWASVGLVNMTIGLVVFTVFAWRRQWTIEALLVGTIQLPIAFVNCAAPLRGFLDPT